MVSILRLQTLISYAASPNPTWNYFELIVWSTVEIYVGLVCACLPTLRLLLVKLFPVLGGSSGRVTGSYEVQNYGTGGPSGAHSRGGHTTHIATVDRSGPDEFAEGRLGITYDKTYNVQYSDNDESSLVPMSDLGKPEEPQPSTTR